MVQSTLVKNVYAADPVGVNPVPAGKGLTVEVSNADEPNGNAPDTVAPPTAFLITVAVELVPGLTVNGSHGLVEPAKLAVTR